MAGGLRQQGIPDLLQEEDEHIEDVRPDAWNVNTLTTIKTDFETEIINNVHKYEKLYNISYIFGKPCIYVYFANKEYKKLLKFASSVELSHSPGGVSA